MNEETAVLPVDVCHRRREDFRRTPHSTEPAKRENHPPLKIGAGIQNLCSIVLGSQNGTFCCVPLHRRNVVSKRVLINQLSTDRSAEKLLGDSTVTPNSVLRVPFAVQVGTETDRRAPREWPEGR